MSGERILVIVPSRARSGRLTVMLDAVLSLSGPGTHVAVCTDDDDPERDEYDELREAVREHYPGRTFWHRGPRKNLAGWTNLIAEWPRAARYGYLASFGDDHGPRTAGWDERLASAIETIGGTGIAWGNDLHQHENLPTAPVISADIPRVLGWMVLPGVVSKFCDNAWRDIADLAGCRAYVPQVIIEHVHPDAGKAALDDTYRDGNAHWARDEAAYLAWAQNQRDLDAQAVRNARRLRAMARVAAAP